MPIETRPKVFFKGGSLEHEVSVLAMAVNMRDPRRFVRAQTPEHLYTAYLGSGLRTFETLRKQP